MKVTMNINELLKPDKTYNQFVDDEIKKAGSVKWLENALQEGLFDHLIKKQWYSEAAYVLFRMDEICRKANLPLLIGKWCESLRSLHLYDDGSPEE